MNIHHLELFYYVARHGGISEAVRNMPYGIQQPAVSSQVLQLEDHLGVTLFHRRPFALTPSGEKLFQFIEPFFSRIEGISAELQGGMAQQLRIGAAEIILRDHLPMLLQNLRKKFPRLRLALREGYQPELEAWLLKQEIDLAITVLDRKPPAGLQATELLNLPLQLVVEKGSKLTSADQLFKRERIEEPLICLPPSETICKNFQQGLAKLGIGWLPSIEVGTLELINTYVASGFGVGLSIAQPKSKLPPGVRALPLTEFPRVTIGILWHGKRSALFDALLAEVQARVSELSS
jgi:DNA-binding transcriptional LysR family regulator